MAARRRRSALVVKLVMVGDSSVGKTSLLLRFGDDIFSARFVSTIGVDYRDRQVVLDGSNVHLQVWDTAGQERFRSVTQNFFAKGDAFVFVYDVTSRESFDSVRSWMAQAKEFAGDTARDPATGRLGGCVVCANKVDTPRAEHVVSAREGRALADELGAGFFETSAKTSKNVDDAFLWLAARVKERCQAAAQRGGAESVQVEAGAGGAGEGGCCFV